jgi:hypothetical protein
MPQTIDLIGPKGYTHGYVYHGSSPGTRTHTSRMAAGDARRMGGSLKNASPSLAADRASAALRGGKHSDYQHLAAARLHSAAARSASSPELKARHLKMAAMHRGIAGRTPGRGTRSEGPLRSAPHPSSSGGKLPTGKAALTKEGRAAALKAGHAISPPRPGAPAGFPVTDAKSWGKALQAVGRAGSPARRAELQALLRRTAAQYGKTKALKASWAAANDQAALEFAMRNPRPAITSPVDLIITRDTEDGSAVVRHRRGGEEIGRIRHGDDGQWRAARDGRELGPHTRQRGALLELIGTHNRAAGTPYHRPAAQEPEKREASALAEALGIPDLDLDAAQLATPAGDSDDGPRVTGLSSGGTKIYKRLRGRGFPHARAQAFAARAQRKMGGGGK